MIKYIFTYYLLLIGTFSNGQLTNYSYFIHQDSIENIKEWRINYDSIGQPLDTILEYEFIYDKEGELIEKRSDFNNNRTMYVAIKYSYNEKKGVKEEKYENPYVIMGGYFRGYPDSKCETYNRNGDPVSTVLVYDGNTESWIFEYDANYLIEKKVYYNGRLKEKYFIEYKKWK